jgi:hypothetical protein
MQGGTSSRRGHIGRRTTRQRALAALLAATVLAPHPTAAQDQDSAVMRGQILDTLVVNNDADLDFGDIIPGTANGTVVLTPSATPTCTANNGIVRTGTCRAARFDGDARFLFLLRVTKPAGNQLTLTGPMGATMLVSNLSYAMPTANIPLASTATEQRYLILTGSGNFTLYVGGTLNVASNQRPGVYNGTFSISFNYD